MASVPAPSFVEATLGHANASPTVAESATARSLMARMIAEGSAVPLNLLGASGTTAETPDFLASTAAFAYVFTLRGDKNWKQMPDPAGANKVSPLAMNTYALLLESGPQTVATLVTELGKGLTEAAVLRALGELWQQLRIIPVLQQNGKPTVWEPIASRLIKQVKAGANAGAPTALSALISLYLAQSLLATEDEIETFLSPLSPRSRIRDVVHALAAAQQLETMTIAGRHHLHISGELPSFEGEAVEREMTRRVPRLTEDGSRIRKMARGTAPEMGRAKPFRGDRPAAPGWERGSGGGSGGRSGGRSDRGSDRAERTPGGGGFGGRQGGEGFRPRPAAGRGAGDRPARFDRPGREGGPGGFRGGEGRPAGPGGPGGPGGERPFRPGGERSFRPGGDRSFRPGGDRPFRPREDRPARDPGDRPARFDRPWEEGKRSPAGDRPAPHGDRRPAREMAAGGDDRGPARREGFRPGGGAERGGDRPAFGRKPSERRPFDRGAEGRAGGFRPRPGGAGGEERGSFRPRAPRPGFQGAGERGSGDRPGRSFPPRREFGGSGDRPARPFREDPGEGRGFAPRPPRDGDARGPRPPFRKFDAPREGARPFRPRPQEDGGGGEQPRRTFGSDRAAGDRPGGAGRPFRPTSGGDRERRPAREGFGHGGPENRRPAGKAFGAKPFGPKPFGAKPGGKSFAAKPGGARTFRAKPGEGQPRGNAPGAGPFEKFKGGNKPWGKRPPARKIKREGEEG